MQNESKFIYFSKSFILPIPCEALSTYGNLGYVWVYVTHSYPRTAYEALSDTYVCSSMIK